MAGFLAGFLAGWLNDSIGAKPLNLHDELHRFNNPLNDSGRFFGRFGGDMQSDKYYTYHDYATDECGHIETDTWWVAQAGMLVEQCDNEDDAQRRADHLNAVSEVQTP